MASLLCMACQQSFHPAVWWRSSHFSRLYPPLHPTSQQYPATVVFQIPRPNFPHLCCPIGRSMSNLVKLYCCGAIAQSAEEGKEIINFTLHVSRFVCYCNANAAEDNVWLTSFQVARSWISTNRAPFFEHSSTASSYLVGVQLKCNLKPPTSVNSGTPIKSNRISVVKTRETIDYKAYLVYPRRKPLLRRSQGNS